MARILIAKQDEESLQSFLAALEIEGHECEVRTTANTVRTGLVYNPSHLVISDADFPGLDAFEMVRVLQDTHGDTIPLLAVHSEDTEGDQIAFTWSGLADRPEFGSTAIASWLNRPISVSGTGSTRPISSTAGTSKLYPWSLARTSSVFSTVSSQLTHVFHGVGPPAQLRKVPERLK